MSLQVHTAPFWYRDPDRLDITRMRGREGLPFAPSWAILQPVLNARSRGGRALSDAWAAYVPAYRAEMAASYVTQHAAWAALLARERVVLVCFCVDHWTCHRTLLAKGILPELGARYMGEMSTQAMRDQL